MKRQNDPIMAGEKRCICCGELKDVAQFHVHRQMKDGRLNKCSACVMKAVSEWRRKNPESRADEYLRGRGADIEARGRKRRKNGEGYSPEKRKISALKYFSKRRSSEFSMPKWDDELDTLAIEEAKRLAEIRRELTGFDWHVDHIVPINHKEICGLHNAYNLNVAPAKWNVSKGNRVVGRYFGY